MERRRGSWTSTRVGKEEKVGWTKGWVGVLEGGSREGF